MVTTNPLYVEVSCGRRVVRLGGAGTDATSGLSVTSDGIEGWHSTPDAKVSMTEMQTGDGAHAVDGSQVLYGARTVTVPWAAVGTTRDDALASDLLLLATAHEVVRLRVVDASSDTYVTGYTQVGTDAGVSRPSMTGTLTVTCADPRRYATTARTAQMLTLSRVPGGLSYGTAGLGLVYDLDYGGTPETLQNHAVIENHGTSVAYPVVTVTGPIDGGLRIDWDGGSVAYSQPVGAVPLVLDSLTRTASVGGLDTSRHLTARGFPTVPAGGSISMTFQGTGTGWADVVVRDTYI